MRGCCRSLTTTRSVYRLHDYGKAAPSCLARPSCVAGKVKSADEFYLVIELVRPDTKHAQCSTVPVPADGAGGFPLD